MVSMGTEISDNDVLHIMALCDEVIEMMEYRDELYDYLKSRMQVGGCSDFKIWQS